MGDGVLSDEAVLKIMSRDEKITKVFLCSLCGEYPFSAVVEIMPQSARLDTIRAAGKKSTPGYLGRRWHDFVHFVKELAEGEK